MAEVKPAEVSAILRQQLAGFKSESDLQEVNFLITDRIQIKFIIKL